MYTIISATNRIGSNSLKVARQYQLFFAEQEVTAHLLSMEEIKSVEKDETLLAIEKDILIPTEKFIFIMPEYNGSFPGIFKLMIDLVDIRECFYFKKVMLVGVANGRAGNHRGLDVMTNMCHYMKMNVFHDKIPLSGILHELKDDIFIHENTINTVKNQIKGFIKF